jgi:putative endonuclease
MGKNSPAHLRLGVQGESLARQYVEHLGWKVIGQNVRFVHKEIDLIAEYKGVTIFIEVKTRVGDLFGAPEESVNDQKLRKLQAAVALYSRKHPSVKQVRLDVISIAYLDTGKPQLKHFKAVDGGEPYVTHV